MHIGNPKYLPYHLTDLRLQKFCPGRVANNNEPLVVTMKQSSFEKKRLVINSFSEIEHAFTFVEGHFIEFFISSPI